MRTNSCMRYRRREGRSRRGTHPHSLLGNPAVRSWARVPLRAGCLQYAVQRCASANLLPLNSTNRTLNSSHLYPAITHLAHTPRPAEQDSRYLRLHHLGAPGLRRPRHDSDMISVLVRRCIHVSLSCFGYTIVLCNTIL